MRFGRYPAGLGLAGGAVQLMGSRDDFLRKAGMCGLTAAHTSSTRIGLCMCNNAHTRARSGVRRVRSLLWFGEPAAKLVNEAGAVDALVQVASNPAFDKVSEPAGMPRCPDARKEDPNPAHSTPIRAGNATRRAEHASITRGVGRCGHAIHFARACGNHGGMHARPTRAEYGASALARCASLPKLFDILRGDEDVELRALAGQCLNAAGLVTNFGAK